MMWVRLDCMVSLHPKLRRAGPEAAWLWVCGLAHANRFTTDGVLAADDLDALYPHAWTPARLQTLAKKLVDVRLWEVRADGGWMIRGYEEYQREAMRDAVEERREWEKTRKADQRRRKKTSHPGEMSQGDRGGTGVGQAEGHVPASVPGTSPPPVPGVSPGVSQPPVRSGPIRTVPTSGIRSARGATQTPDPDPIPAALPPSPAPAPTPRVTPEQLEAMTPPFIRAALLARREASNGQG